VDVQCPVYGPTYVHTGQVRSGAGRVNRGKSSPPPADGAGMEQGRPQRLVRACALLLLPALVGALPVAATLTAHPDQDAPTFTVRDTTVSMHLDEPPPGVDVHTTPSTQSLIAAAGLTTKRSLNAPSAQRGGPVLAMTTAPPGTPTTSSLSQHVLPSCSGVSDGNTGDRVQVAYVTQVGSTDRYASVLPALQSYVADVDDVMAVSADETGGGRRVRWVVDGQCVPTILHVVLPAGSLGSSSDSDGGFTATINAMEAKGYNASDRKYLMFAEADNLCGIAQVYPTSAKTNNYNNGFAPMFARVDSACWTSTYHSVASHELMHTLGSVMSDSLHPSAAGHCTDDYDVMCYADGAGVAMTYPCPAWHEQLYDCGHDDYFSTDPVASSYLGTHWNTADSAFLDVVPALDASATLTLAAPSELRPGLSTTVSVTDPAPAGATYSWSVTPTVCLVGSATAASATVMCPADQTGAVDVSVYRAASGQAELGTTTIQPVAAGPDPLTVTLSAPATLAVGAVATVTGTVTDGSQPVRTTATWYSAPAGSTAWVRIAGPAPTSVAGATSISVAPSASATYRLVVSAPAASTWTATPAMATVTVVRKPTILSMSVTSGRPDVLRTTLVSGTTRLPGYSVSLYYHYAGTSTWVLLRRYTTDSTARIAVAVQPKRYAYYLWRFSGSTVYAPVSSGQAVVTY
jgi:hypothetical protein